MGSAAHVSFRSVYADPGGRIPDGEIVFISILLTLTLLAIVIEIVHRLRGQSYLTTRQFWLRMGGGSVMLALVGMITFGALFVRPQDGRIYGWFWAFCSLMLLIVVMVLRADVAWTRRQVRTDRLRMRDERLEEVKQIIERHRHVTALQSTGAEDTAPDPSIPVSGSP